LRAALLRVEEDDFVLDEERRLVELDLRAVDPELRELVLREPEPRELVLERRPLELDDLRDDDPPDDFLRDEPLPLLPPDSAIAILLRSLVHAWCAPHYMPTLVVT
jgi:hypothetical protein